MMAMSRHQAYPGRHEVDKRMKRQSPDTEGSSILSQIDTRFNRQTITEHV
jgi:hypothetical protein